MPGRRVMLEHLHDLLGPSAANWALVILAGIVFLALASVLPTLVARCRGRQGPPLL